MRATIEVAMTEEEAVRLLKYILSREGISYRAFETDFSSYIVTSDMAIEASYDRDRNTTVLKVVAEDMLAIKRILTPAIRKSIIDFYVTEEKCRCECSG